MIRKCLNKLSISVFAVLLVLSSSTFAQSVGTDEIVSKHIASMGGSAKLAEIKNRIVAGASEFESKFPTIKTTGKALIASDATNMMLVASFASKEYPMEKIGYFVNKANLPWVTAGARSPLGAYLADNEIILADGIFGGSMSSKWLMLNQAKRDGVLKSLGTRRIDGRKVYALEYISKGIGSQAFTIVLSFDAETFHHVRTEYRHEVSTRQDTFGQLGRQGGALLTLVESFGDFRTVDGYTFPYDYKASYRTESNSGTYEYIWGIKVGAYNLNRNLAPDFFRFDPS
jgi:hypothetical protein